MQEKWQCRIAPSLGGGFEGHPNKVWGTKDYTNDQEPAVFFGLYGLPDFYTLWKHKGKKAILWAGTDILHFKNGYWLEDGAHGIKLDPKPLAEWINKHCDNYCENHREQATLKNHGIDAKVVPSFLGDVNAFTPQHIDPKERFYSSVSGDDFDLYGWQIINDLATTRREVEFHLYGNTAPWEAPKNVIVHGRVPKDQMNEETKSMTGAIRMTRFDGCSELIVKSVLWGQKPLSLIHYPFLDAENPREELLKIINKYPWNEKI